MGMHIDKNQFLEYVTNPGALAYQPDTGMLEEIVRQYPYFQSAHLLLTLGYHQTNSIYFDQALGKTALYAGEREALYRLVHHSYKTALTTASNKTPQKEQELKELDHLINQSSQALSTDQLLKEISESKSPDTAATEQEKKPPQQANKDSEGFSFLDWLEKVGSKNTKAQREKTAATSENHDSEQTATGLPSKKTSTKGPQRKPDQKAIVDAFLENPPKLKRPKSEFYNPEEKAQRSVKEDDELVSEPLAQIHFQQGNYKKAIQIYEKLSLLYPDKFHYFAEQIDSVKKHQKP